MNAGIHLPILPMESTDLLPVLQKRFFWLIPWESLSQSLKEPMKKLFCFIGLLQLPLCYRYILTFPVTAIWRSVWVACLGSVSLKISTIPLFPRVLQNSGEGGICHWVIGSGIMFISQWVAIVYPKQNGFEISLWSGY